PPPAVVKEPEQSQQKPKEENPAEEPKSPTPNFGIYGNFGNPNYPISPRDTNEPDDSSNYKLEIRNYKSQGVSMPPSTSSPDHPITRSPDHPIPWTWTAIET